MATANYWGAPSWEDLATWVGTIVGEGGAEPTRGKAAIMDSALNRSQDTYFAGRYGNNIADQFTARNGAEYNAWKPKKNPAYAPTVAARDFILSEAFQRDPEAALANLSDPRVAAQYKDTLTAIRGVMGTGDMRGIAGGTMYYSNPKHVADTQWQTHLNMGMEDPNVYTVGNHQFYGIGNGTTRFLGNGSSFDWDNALQATQQQPSNLPFDQAGYGGIPGAAGYTYFDGTGTPIAGPGFDQWLNHPDRARYDPTGQAPAFTNPNTPNFDPEDTNQFLPVVPDKYTSLGPPGSDGVDRYGRVIWNGYVQNDTGQWVPPDHAGALANNAADWSGRQVWNGYVLGDDGSWVLPGTGGEMDTGMFDAYGRQVWSGYVQGDDSAWYRPGAAGAFAEGAVDSGGRTIYNGYVQDDAGAWVRPGTAGPLMQVDPAPPGPVLPDGSVDGLGRTIYGGYVKNDQGIWVPPAPGGHTPDLEGPGVPTFTESANNPNNVGGTIQTPSASTLNGFDTPGTGYITNTSFATPGMTMTMPEGGEQTSGIGTSLFYPYSGSAEASAALTANTTATANASLEATRIANAKSAADNLAAQQASEAEAARIAAAAAAAGQTNVNTNIANLNPTDIFNTWNSGQSTQWQPY